MARGVRETIQHQEGRLTQGHVPAAAPPLTDSARTTIKLQQTIWANTVSYRLQINRPHATTFPSLASFGVPTTMLRRFLFPTLGASLILALTANPASAQVTFNTTTYPQQQSLLHKWRWHAELRSPRRHQQRRARGLHLSKLRILHRVRGPVHCLALHRRWCLRRSCLLYHSIGAQ
jgi:hypothetical protein